MRDRKTYFWTKVDRQENECWPWVGYRDPRGYGRYGRIPAQRIAWELTRGPIPAGLSVCHLFLGTQFDNVADMVRKGRGRSTTRRGEASNKAKLTAEQVLAIFNSPEQGTDLAIRYGVSPTAIYYIKNGKNWSHLTGGINASR